MGVQFWFFIHRPLMICVPFISVISFLLIFWNLNWEWVESKKQPNFAHSITGIITISLSFLQVREFLYFCGKASFFRHHHENTINYIPDQNIWKISFLSYMIR